MLLLLLLLLASVEHFNAARDYDALTALNINH
jgi:hypothetical protein